MLHTLKYLKALEGAGISREQAEAQVQMIAEIVEEGLASKQDIKDLKEELQKMEYRLTIRAAAIGASVVATTVALLNFILK